MGSPNGEKPAGSYSYATAASMQTVDPNAYSRAGNADMRDALEGVRGNLLTNLLGGFFNIPQALGSLLNDIGLAITGGPNSALSGVLRSINQMISGIKTQGDANKADTDKAIKEAQEAASRVAAQGAAVQAVKAAILQFEDNVPLESYEHSMTNSQMTFGREWFGDEPLTGVALSGSVSNNTSTSWNRHRHQETNGSNTGYETLDSHGHADTFAVSSTRTPFQFTPPANSVVGGFVRAKWGGLRESFTFATGPVSSPCALQLIVFTMNPDNGDLTVRWVSEDQTPIIGTSTGEFVPAIPGGVLLAARGDVFLAVHQYGAGNVRPLWCKTEAPPARDGLLYPSMQNARFGRSSALSVGQVVPASSVATSNKLPWLGVGLSLTIPVPPPTSYYQDFDDNTMPSSLVRRSSTEAAIYDGVFHVAGGTDGERNYQITKRLNRDDHYIESQMIYGDTSQPQFLGLRADVNGYNRIVARCNRDGVQIQRRGASDTQFAAVSTPMPSGTVVRFVVVGNVYSVYRVNGTQLTLLCQYVDSSNALPRGVDNRYTTLGVHRFLLSNSGGWSYVLAADLQDAA